MGSFGENLRRERELRGISLDEIAQHTKLSTRTLEAIEKNRFDQLPGGMFNRSFVLHYARYLGLDEARVGADFDTAFAASSLDIRQVATQRDDRKVPDQRDWSFLEKLQPLRGLLAGVLIAALLLGAGIVALRRGWLGAARAAIASRVNRLGKLPQPPPAVAPAPAQAPVAEASSSGTPGSPAAGSPPAEATPGQPGGAPPLPASPDEAALPGPVGRNPAQGSTAPAGGSAEQKPDATAPAAPLLLQIDTPLEGAWVEVVADGRKRWSVEMRPRESRRVRASNNIQVKTGNAGAVILTLNGETQAPLGTRGEVKTVTFSLQDVKKQ